MITTDYSVFVDALLSDPSTDLEAFIARLRDLKEKSNVDITRVITGAVGLSAEAGEFLEIVKKVIFQGKPFNDETAFHIKRELSDIMFYMMTSCQSLGISIEDVIQENITKLESRYPGGKFTVQLSENRKQGDL